MRHRSRAVRLWSLVVLGLAAAGCGGGSEEGEAEVQGGEAYDGLSPAQIESQAEAMSPEQAEELGIVDSTIHMERLTSPEDSALIGDTVR